MPAYYVDNDFKDENGNTDLEAALAQELSERAKKEKASNSSALDGLMMARPIVPSEMFLSASANVFPTAQLRERLTEVEVKDTFALIASQGTLEYTNSERKEVRWVEDVKRRKKPITTMNLDAYKGHLESAIVIYEHPPSNIPAPTYRRSLYKIVYDPVKDDGGGTSLASILVYKGFSTNWEGGMQDTIVAEWIGRLDSVNNIHEIAIKLALYFNAKILVETNIPDFVRYCRMKNKFTLLQPSPWMAISKAIKKPGKKYDVGVTMTKNLAVHCEQLIRQWLLVEWKTSENGKKFRNLHKLLSPRLLNEFITYSRDGNFDHVSSFKLLALWLSQEQEEPLEAAEPTVNKYKKMNTFLAKQKGQGRRTNSFYNF